MSLLGGGGLGKTSTATVPSTPPNRRRRSGDELGSGTALMAVLWMVIGMLLMLGVMVYGYYLAFHRAGQAADLAALAGAQANSVGMDACTAARDIARRNGGELEECTPLGTVIEVVVSVRPSWAFPGYEKTRYRSRAAPDGGS